MTRGNGSAELRIGFFSIGLETYWGQFEGLRNRLRGYASAICQRLSGSGCRVIDADMVDTIDKARAAAELFKREDVSLIFLYVSTYALSSTVLPVVQKTGVPVIVLNLQPSRAIDYAWFNSLGDRTKMTGEWLANCQACAVPEIANVLNRSQVRFHQITGTLEDEESWKEIHDWVDASRVAKVMSENRLGILGHYYNGMLDVYSDPTQQVSFLGGHIEHLEMCELKRLRDAVRDEDIGKKIEQIHREFDVSPECPERELRRAARTACGLDALVESRNLGSLAYYYEGTPGGEYEDIISSVIVGNSLLTAHHVPVAGECEVKNAQAMKIMDAFGAGGSFTEFYAMDFDDDVILLGHDGPGHIAIAEGRPKLKPLQVYHGKPGQGISVEMKVRNGPVTLLSVIQSFDGKLRFLTAEGDSISGPILEIGNTNGRYRFAAGVKGFINEWSRHGPAHHCAVGIGHIADKIEKLGDIMDIEVIRVG